MMGKFNERISFQQPDTDVLTPDKLDVMPRRWAWKKVPITKKTKGWNLITIMPAPNWDDAKCVGREDLFITEKPRPSVVAEAKAMCAGCPVRKQCKAWGLAHEEFGVWGGLDAKERDEERKRIGLSVVEPMEAHLFRLNDDWKSPTPSHCQNGHALKAEYDLVRSKDVTEDDPYRHVYQVQCSQCYYERHESPEARERMREKGKSGSAALKAKGTRNTSKNKWFNP